MPDSPTILHLPSSVCSTTNRQGAPFQVERKVRTNSRNTRLLDVSGEKRKTNTKTLTKEENTCCLKETMSHSEKKKKREKERKSIFGIFRSCSIPASLLNQHKHTGERINRLQSWKASHALRKTVFIDCLSLFSFTLEANLNRFSLCIVTSTEKRSSSIRNERENSRFPSGIVCGVQTRQATSEGKFRQRWESAIQDRTVE